MLMIAYILFLHWVGDFVLQTNWQSNNKYKSLIALSRHLVSYCTCLLVGMFLMCGIQQAIIFAFINSVFHFIIDFFTSKATHKLYDKGMYHYFFVVIGFDQYIHLIILLDTYRWISQL